MRLLTTLLLVTALLAGCTEPGSTDLDPQDVDPEPEPGPGTDAEGGNETQEPPAPEPNTPPTATLTADDTDGNAPLNVTFTLDGSDGDGDDLTWALDRDDDGTVDDQGDSLPATLTYTYEAGDWTARLTVFDGEDEAEATLDVEAFEAEEVPAGPVQELTLAWDVGATFAPTLLDSSNEFCGTDQPPDGVLYRSFDVAPASQGTPMAATVDYNAVAGGTAGWGIVYFDDGCEESEAFSVMDPSPIAGTVPAFATWAIAYSNGGEGVTVSYTAG